MNFVALISGGKDSIFTILKLVQEGHKVICLANLYPPKQQELDSYMYQSVGSEVAVYIAEALELPLIRKEITGKAVNVDLEYIPTKEDEVENLYELLKDVKEQYPDVQAVSSGAILSNYQKNRVEDICNRLGLISFAPLWERDQKELVQEMVDNKMDAILVRVATEGLKKEHLGKTISDMLPTLFKLGEKYGINVCGEGGEFESITLDCPLFKKRIVVEEAEVVTELEDPIMLRAKLVFKKLSLVDKNKSD